MIYKQCVSSSETISSNRQVLACVYGVRLAFRSGVFLRLAKLLNSLVGHVELATPRPAGPPHRSGNCNTSLYARLDFNLQHCSVARWASPLAQHLARQKRGRAQHFKLFSQNSPGPLLSTATRRWKRGPTLHGPCPPPSGSFDVYPVSHMLWTPDLTEGFAPNTRARVPTATGDRHLLPRFGGAEDALRCRTSLSHTKASHPVPPFSSWTIIIAILSRRAGLLPPFSCFVADAAAR